MWKNESKTKIWVLGGSAPGYQIDVKISIFKILLPTCRGKLHKWGNTSADVSCHSLMIPFSSQFNDKT